MRERMADRSDPEKGSRPRGSGRGSILRVVDAVLTGTHEPGTSHYDLLQAFVTGSTLDAIDAELERYGYRTHEFGDSVLLEKARERPAIQMEPGTLSSLQLEAIS